MKKRILILGTIVFLLSINLAFSQDRPVFITLVGGTTLQDANITTQEVLVTSDYIEQKMIAFKDIKEIEFNHLKKEGKIKIILRNGSIVENAKFGLTKLIVDSKILGKLEIPIDGIQLIFWGDEKQKER